MSWVVVVTDRPSEGDLRFLARLGMTGEFGMTVINCHSGECLPPCHSEARTPKNLRCWLMSWLVVVMERPSKGDLRFLAQLGMTGGS